MMETPETLPRVSIGLPVYNGERFLAETLDSLLAQTYGDFELIISDNCSVDRTEEICRAYAAKDSRIRCHRNSSNIGAAKNFNVAFELARGTYFKWAGADDHCSPSLLERCVAVLDERADVVLCYSKTRLVDEEGRSLGDYEDRLDLPFDAASKRFATLLWNLEMCNAEYGLIRADALRQTKLQGVYPSSDTVLLSELALHGRFVELPERLFWRRAYDLSFNRYPSLRDRMVIFDPTRKHRWLFPNWMLFLGHLGAIRRAPLSWPERVRCLLKMRIWIWRWGIGLLEDIGWPPRQPRRKSVAATL